MQRAKALYGKESLHDLEILQTTFRENGYSIKHIRQALNLAVGTSEPKDKPTSVALLPYVQETYRHLSRVLAKRNIKSADLPPGKMSNFLRPVKEDLGV